MDAVLVILKILIISIIGYFLFRIIEKRKGPFYGIISPLYGLFSLVSVFTTIDNMILLFLIGIFWGIIVNEFMGTIDVTLKTNINMLWFGPLNILNYMLLNGVIERFILSSSLKSMTLLLVVGMSLFLIDLSLTLRKLN